MFFTIDFHDAINEQQCCRPSVVFYQKQTDTQTEEPSGGNRCKDTTTIMQAETKELEVLQTERSR